MQTTEALVGGQEGKAPVKLKHF